MINRELREWLGLTLADMLAVFAAVALMGMFYVHDAKIDMALAVAGLAFALASCPLGMKRDPEVSDFTNSVKWVSYPILVLLAIGVIAVHYVWFDK